MSSLEINQLEQGQILQNLKNILSDTIQNNPYYLHQKIQKYVDMNNNKIVDF
jgi:hypothetical protein